MPKEFTAAKELLMSHAKVQSELGMSGGSRLTMKLDVRGMNGRFGGGSIADVLQKPESRHRVLGLLDQLRQIGQTVDEVVDVDGEEID
jgi:biotin operon repressor